MSYGDAPGPMANARYGVDPVTGYPFSAKRRKVASILQITLGAFGAGRFYTGHRTIALAQVTLTLCTCGVGWAWAIVDGIRIAMIGGTDAEGLPLREG